MALLIHFKDGTYAQIQDVCIRGTTMYRLVATGRTYQSERFAMRRALIAYKKRIGTFEQYPRRRKQKPKRRRGTPKNLLLKRQIKPLIMNVYVNGKLHYKVIETDTIWEVYNEAIKNAIEYKKRAEGS